VAERFDLFRLSLLVRQQRDAFEEPDPTREEYLRRVFGEKRTFSFYRTVFHYVPEDPQARPDVLMGRIGRALSTEENSSPDEGFRETTHAGWRAVTIVIDPKHHDDGQKVAVEVNKQVGKASGLISGLVEAINDANPHTAYVVEVAPIINAESFWQFAAKNKGMITKLTFEFVAPNMFGGTDDLSEELRAFRQRENAEKVTIALQSNEGLETNTDRTREAVNYAVQGCGMIKARSKSGKHYDSSKTNASSKLDEPADEDTRPTLVRLASLVGRILARE
jgi:hypothetical protein